MQLITKLKAQRQRNTELRNLREQKRLVLDLLVFCTQKGFSVMTLNADIHNDIFFALLDNGYKLQWSDDYSMAHVILK